MAPFGSYAPEFVKRVAHRPEAPDIYVSSVVEAARRGSRPSRGLMGRHGGLGSWQDRAMAVIPSDLPFPEERVVGGRCDARRDHRRDGDPDLAAVMAGGEAP